MLYVSGPPAVAGLGSAVLVICKSAVGSTTVRGQMAPSLKEAKKVVEKGTPTAVLPLWV